MNYDIMIKKHFSKPLKDYKLHDAEYKKIIDKINKHKKEIKKTSLLAIVFTITGLV